MPRSNMWVFALMFAVMALGGLISGVAAEQSASISSSLPQVTVAITKSIVVISNKFSTFTQVDTVIASVQSPMVSLGSTQPGTMMTISVSPVRSSPHTTTTSTLISVSTSTDPPSATSSSGTDFAGNRREKSMTPVIIGVIVSVIVAILLAFGLRAYLKRRKQQNSRKKRIENLRAKVDSTPLQMMLPMPGFSRDLSLVNQGPAGAAAGGSILQTKFEYNGYPNSRNVTSSGTNGNEPKVYGPEYGPGGSRRPPSPPRNPSRENSIAGPNNSLATQNTSVPQNPNAQQNTHVPTYPPRTTSNNSGNVLPVSNYGSQSSSAPPRPKRTSSLSPSIIEYMRYGKGNPGLGFDEENDKIGKMTVRVPQSTTMSTSSAPPGTSMTPSLQGDIMDSPAYRNLLKQKAMPNTIRSLKSEESVYSQEAQPERNMSPQALNVVKNATSGPNANGNNAQGSTNGGFHVTSARAVNTNGRPPSTTRGNTGNIPIVYSPLQQNFRDLDETDMAKRDADRRKAYDALQRRTFHQAVNHRVTSSVYSRNVDGTPVSQSQPALPVQPVQPVQPTQPAQPAPVVVIDTRDKTQYGPKPSQYLPGTAQ